MRILVVTYYFPPDSAVGAIRPAKVVRALEARGHDVQVIASMNGSPGVEHPNLHRVRPLRNPREFYLARKRAAQVASTASAGPGIPSSGGAVPDALPAWKRYLFSLLWLPDDRQGFVWPAYRMARLLAHASRFDVVYTSAPPFSVHLVGWMLSVVARTRWVAEFRDPWLDGVPKPWHVRSAFSDFLDRRLERACLLHASEVVAVTYAAAETIGAKRAMLGKPAPRVMLNGIDSVTTVRRAPSSGTIRAVHVGSLYHSRDPRPLLRALASLAGSDRRNSRGCAVEFIGDAHWYGDISVEEYARSIGAGELVKVRDAVPHSEVEQILADADLLVLLAQQQPAQVPNKLYEYLGHRKPILAFADDDGETAAMLRRAGGHFIVTERDGDRIESILRDAIDAAANPAWAPNDAQLNAWRTTEQMERVVSVVEG